jgi:hypothetical protein
VRGRRPSSGSTNRNARCATTHDSVNATKADARLRTRTRAGTQAGLDVLVIDAAAGRGRRRFIQPRAVAAVGAAIARHPRRVVRRASTLGTEDTYAGAVLEVRQAVADITRQPTVHLSAASSGGIVTAGVLGHLAEGTLGEVARLPPLRVCA